MAFGITINSLTAQSCDANWTPGFIQSGQGNHSFKLLELDEFAVYWMMFEPEQSYVNLSVAELAVSISRMYIGWYNNKSFLGVDVHI